MIKWWWVVLHCYILVFLLFQAISQNVILSHPMGFPDRITYHNFLCRTTQHNCSIVWTDLYLTSRGALNFFSGRGVRPGFPKCGACQLTFASEKGGLWAENFQIWGLVSSKFPNLGPCELKFGWKLRLLRLKFPNFLKRGVLWTDSFAWNRTLASGRSGMKRGSSGPHIPIPPF